jgi:hypothetical protein
LSNRESLKTWAAVAVLLIFAGVASAVVPFVLDQAGSDDATVEEATREPLETTVDVSQLPFIGEVLVEIPFIADNVQGLPVSALQAFGVAFGVVLVSTGGMGLLITIVVLLFSRFVSRVYEDEAYQQSTSTLQEQEKNRLSEIQKAKPPTSESDKEKRSRWSLGIYAFIFLLFVWIVGLTLGATYLADTEVQILGQTFSGTFVLNLILGLSTILILYLSLRKAEPEEWENPPSDNNPVNWGFIWIVVSGLLIVGLGAGAALAMRGG